MFFFRRIFFCLLALVFFSSGNSSTSFSGLQQWKQYQKAETLDVFYQDRIVGTLYHTQTVVDSLRAINNTIHLAVAQNQQGMSVDLEEKRQYDSGGNLVSASSVIKSQSGANEWVLQKKATQWDLELNIGGVKTEKKNVVVNENLNAMDRIYAAVAQRNYHTGMSFSDTSFDLVTGKPVATRYSAVSMDPVSKQFVFEMVDDRMARSQKWILDSNGNTVEQEIEGLFIAKKRKPYPVANIGEAKKDIDFTELLAAPVARSPEIDDRILVELPGRERLDSSVLAFYTRRSDIYLVNKLVLDTVHDKIAKTESELLRYTVPTTTMQSNHPSILSLSKRIKSAATNRLAIIEACNTYVYKTLIKRNTATFSSAVETLHAGFGDCGEHSVLCAALLRAAKIPARVVLGLVYYAPKKSFVGHAWVLVYVNNKPLFCDPAFGIFPVSNDRIPLIIDDDGTHATELAKFIGRINVGYEKNRSTDN